MALAVSKFSTKLFAEIFIKRHLNLNNSGISLNNKWLSITKLLSTVTNNSAFGVVDQQTYEKACSVTLESLCDYFEEIIEKQSNLHSADVNYGDGVLTVNFGQSHGTYVINRQSPNKQIWLSSPTTGPKRYDLLGEKENEKWIYKHNNESLHDLLQREIKTIIKDDIDFYQLPYGK